MSAQLRQVANLEKENRSIIRLPGLDVGVRLFYPYLLHPLQSLVYERPNGTFVSQLEVAGRISRDPAMGPGFIQIFLNRIEIPTKDWAAVDRGEDPPTVVERIPFSDEVQGQLRRVCTKAHHEHLAEVLDELVKTLRADWWSCASMHETASVGIVALSKDSYLRPETLEMFRSLSGSILSDSPIVPTNAALPL